MPTTPEYAPIEEVIAAQEKHRQAAIRFRDRDTNVTPRPPGIPHVERTIRHYNTILRALEAQQEIAKIKELQADSPSCGPATGLPNEALVQTCLEVYARSFQYDTPILHERWVECRAELLRRLEAQQEGVDGWAVFDGAGNYVTSSVRFSQRASINAARQQLEIAWTDMKAEGFRCRRVRITPVDQAIDAARVSPPTRKESS